MRTFKTKSLLKGKKNEIMQENLIYERIDGKPVYFHNYKDVLIKSKTMIFTPKNGIIQNWDMDILLPENKLLNISKLIEERRIKF